MIRITIDALDVAVEAGASDFVNNIAVPNVVKVLINSVVCRKELVDWVIDAISAVTTVIGFNVVEQEVNGTVAKQEVGAARMSARRREALAIAECVSRVGVIMDIDLPRDTKTRRRRASGSTGPGARVTELSVALGDE